MKKQIILAFALLMVSNSHGISQIKTPNAESVDGLACFKFLSFQRIDKKMGKQLIPFNKKGFRKNKHFKMGIRQSSNRDYKINSIWRQILDEKFRLCCNNCDEKINKSSTQLLGFDIQNVNVSSLQLPSYNGTFEILKTHSNYHQIMEVNLGISNLYSNKFQDSKTIESLENRMISEKDYKIIFWRKKTTRKSKIGFLKTIGYIYERRFNWVIHGRKYKISFSYINNPLVIVYHSNITKESLTTGLFTMNLNVCI